MRWREKMKVDKLSFLIIIQMTLTVLHKGDIYENSHISNSKK